MSDYDNTIFRLATAQEIQSLFLHKDGDGCTQADHEPDKKYHAKEKQQQRSLLGERGEAVPTGIIVCIVGLKPSPLGETFR